MKSTYERMYEARQRMPETREPERHLHMWQRIAIGAWRWMCSIVQSDGFQVIGLMGLATSLVIGIIGLIRFLVGDPDAVILASLGIPGWSAVVCVVVLNTIRGIRLHMPPPTEAQPKAKQRDLY